MAGPDRLLTRRALNRALLERQLLLGRKPLRATQVVERLGGLQAQSTPSPYLSLWTRLEGFERDELTKALAGRRLVKALLQRGTLHVVAPRTYWAIMTVRRTLAASLWPPSYEARLPSARIAELAELLQAELDGNELTYKQVRALLEPHAPDGVPATFLWRRVQSYSYVIHVPPSGIWGYGGHGVYTAAAGKVRGEPSAPKDAFDEIVRTYLAAYGPATKKDIGQWAGVPRMQPITESLERLSLRTFASEDGKVLYDLPRAPLPDPETPAPTRLVPRFDNLVLSHADRSRVLGDVAPSRIVTNNGLVHATILVDGFVAGTWQLEHGRVRLEPFGRLEAAAKRTLKDEAERLESFVARRRRERTTCSTLKRQCQSRAHSPEKRRRCSRLPCSSRRPGTGAAAGSSSNSGKASRQDRTDVQDCRDTSAPVTAAVIVRIVCGICGVIQVSGSPRQVVSPETLDRMTDVMRHRGPNDRGTYQVDGVALGVRRLSIIDVEDGHQPVANETSSIVAVQNGELFNHDEVRKQLVARGHTLQTRCDTEILPHLYEEAGDDLGQRLNGMFAIALWDGPRRRGLVIRDRLGVKPLYYAEVGDLLVFGSELKAVLASRLVSEELDWEAIDTYLRLGFIPAPRTPFAAVSKLLPGCRLLVERGRVVEERWWSYPAQDPRSSGLTMRENAAALLELLEDSVRLELMSDVPLGVMLSGGLDSSLLAALMSRNLSDPVQTFSVGFAEDTQTSELDDARAVASAIGATHHELKLSIDEVELDLAGLLWHLDEPIADLSTLGFHALCKLAAEHVTVALCGQGSDELYGGYDKHRAAAMLRQVGFLPGPLRTAVTGPLALGGARLSRIARTARAGTPTDRLLAMSGIADTELRRSLVRGPLASLDGQSARRAIERVAPPGAADQLSETLFMDGQLALPDDMLHFTDRMSMAHSLEVRVPYLDYRLVEHSARIPSNHKVRGLTTKVVLKEAARGVIPDEIIDKRKIGFFGQATNAWLNRHLDGALGNYLLDPGARYVEFLDRGAVERLVRSHSARTEKQGDRLLLAILMLEIWLSSYLPQSGPSSDHPVSTDLVA